MALQMAGEPPARGDDFLAWKIFQLTNGKALGQIQTRRRKYVPEATSCSARRLVAFRGLQGACSLLLDVVPGAGLRFLAFEFLL